MNVLSRTSVFAFMIMFTVGFAPFLTQDAFANTGDAITEVAELEHDTANVEGKSLVKLDSDTFVVAYAGSGTDGYIATFTISADGTTITEEASLEHDTLNGQYNSLIQIDSDTFALAYESDLSDGKISTFDISADGKTITLVQTLEFELNFNGETSWAQVDSDTYVLAFTGNSNDGFITTFTISADGETITEVFELEHDEANGRGSSIVKIDSDTFAVAYQSDGNDGTISTFDIPADGSTITEVGTLEHDTNMSPDIAYNSLVQVDSDTYALAYTGTNNDGYITTFTINAAGTSIVECTSCQLEHDTATGVFNSLVQVDSDTYALAYTGDDNDGYITTFTIPADGSTITEVKTLEHDTDNGKQNSLVKVDSDTFALAFAGDGSDGYITTFTITTATVPAAPTLTATVGNTQIPLSWTGSDGGAAITDYIIEFRTVANPPVSFAVFSDGTSANTGAAVTGLTNGVSYDFRVSAINSVGTSSLSSTATATPNVIPVVEQSVTVCDSNAGTGITLPSWSPQADETIILALFYLIEGTDPANIAGNGLTWSLIGHVDNAAGAGGTSLYRASSSSTPSTGSITFDHASTDPIIGTAVRISGVDISTNDGVEASASSTGGDNDDVLLSVTTVADNAFTIAFASQRGSAVLTPASGETEVWESAADCGSSGSRMRGHIWHETGVLSPAGSVQLGGTADLSGDQKWSAWAIAITPKTDAVPAAPTSLAATLGDTQVALTWVAPSSTPALTDYKIEYSSDSGTSWTTFADGTSTNVSETVTSLTNNQSYDFRVSAINSVGTGSVSNVPSATPNWAAPVASNMIVIPGNGTATIKWDVSVSADPITSVDVETNSTNDGSTFTSIASGNVSFTDSTDGTRSLVVSGLTNDQTYILKITPTNTGGDGSETNIVVVMPTANPNTEFNFIQPPDDPSDALRTEMIALGLSSDFVMPSAGYVPSSSFDPFDESLNQNLMYTTAIATSVSLDTILIDYAVQQYTKPSAWTVNDVWTVPPAIIPLAGNVGEAAAYRMNQVDSMKPIFTAFNGATELANGGKLGGVKYALQSAASNLNMTQKFLSEAPSGVTSFDGAKMYMSFDIETSTDTRDFGSAATFSTLPVVSFTMGPDSTAVSDTANTVNAAIVCPQVIVNFISGDTASSAGITVTRDTNGDTSTACGYSATLQHFSNYYADTIRPDGSSDSPGGSCNDCTPPTLGMTKGGLIRVVDNGFSYNNNPIDVQYFYTPYPLLTVEIGQENVVELKIYENSGASYLKHVGMSFGLGPQQLFGAGIVLIEWDRLFDGTEKVSVTDPNNLLEDDVRVDVSPDLVKCTASSITEQCTVIRIYHTFREAPEFQMLSTYVWDQKRNGWQNYYNHGIEVVGESLNPPDEYDGVNKGHIYHLMETGKGMAVDEFGNSWTFHHGIWNKDYVKSPFLRSSITNVEKLQALESLGLPKDTVGFGYDRNQPEFALYKIGQTLLAQQIMDELCMQCSDEPFDKINNITLSKNKDPTLRSDDIELQKALSQENIRAMEVLGDMFEQMYPDMVFDGKTLSYQANLEKKQ